jgi:hypothetical protein
MDNVVSLIAGDCYCREQKRSKSASVDFTALLDPPKVSEVCPRSMANESVHPPHLTKSKTKQQQNHNSGQQQQTSSKS